MALHQAIAEALPLRLEFYESYLDPRRLRTGNLGLASFGAALSFLRRDGGAYAVVVRESGRLAADWTWETLPRYRRASWRRLPASWRARAVLRVARRLVADTVDSSRATSRVTRGVGRLVIEGSGFCDTRAVAAEPLCGFYAAAIERWCEHLSLVGRARAEECRVLGAAACVIVLRLAATPDEHAAEIDTTGAVS